MEKKNNKQEHLLDLQWVRRALLLALIGCCDYSIIISNCFNGAI